MHKDSLDFFSSRICAQYITPSKKKQLKKDHTEVRLINDKFTFAILIHVMNGKIHTHYTAVERYKEDFISKYPASAFTPVTL